MIFKAWVKFMGGPTEAAKILGTSKQNVSNWANFKDLPRDNMKKKIFDKSYGKVSYEEMIEPFFKHCKR